MITRYSRLKSQFFYTIIIFVGLIHNGFANTENTQLNSINSKTHLATLANYLSVSWTIDNKAPNTTILKDLGWHLLTLTVTRANGTTTPEKVDGLTVYSASTDKKQNIVFDDIDCNQAVLQKVGDSCSTYFKFDYDPSLLNDENTVYFYTQIKAKNSNISAQVLLDTTINLNTSVGDYRAVNRKETKYYSGANVIQDKAKYQIILMQNGGPAQKSITINKLDTPSNKTFTVVPRSSSGLDQNYGNNPECSLTDNPGFSQTNHLDRINDYCIIIYKTEDISTHPSAVTDVTIGTNATSIFPANSNQYSFISNYSKNTTNPIYPINPQQGIKEGKGTITTAYPFDRVVLEYQAFATRSLRRNQVEHKDQIINHFIPSGYFSADEYMPGDRILVRKNPTESGVSEFLITHKNQIEYSSEPTSFDVPVSIIGGGLGFLTPHHGNTYFSVIHGVKSIAGAGITSSVEDYGYHEKIDYKPISSNIWPDSEVYTEFLTKDFFRFFVKGYVTNAKKFPCDSVSCKYTASFVTEMCYGSVCGDNRVDKEFNTEVTHNIFFQPHMVNTDDLDTFYTLNSTNLGNPNLNTITNNNDNKLMSRQLPDYHEITRETLGGSGYAKYLVEVPYNSSSLTQSLTYNIGVYGPVTIKFAPYYGNTYNLSSFTLMQK